MNGTQDHCSRTVTGFNGNCGPSYEAAASHSVEVNEKA